MCSLRASIVLHFACRFWDLGLERFGMVIMVGTVGWEGLVCMGRTDMGFWLDILLVYVLLFCDLLMIRMFYSNILQ